VTASDAPGVVLPQGVDVEARWWGSKDVPGTEGPRQLVITLTDKADPRALTRGITTGVLRQIEASLGELGRSRVAASPPATDYWRKVVEWAGSLPPKPRGNPGYYPELLALFDFLAATTPRPVVELTRALNEAGRPLSMATVNTQLHNARRTPRANGDG
jgi:hypothetical protein